MSKRDYYEVLGIGREAGGTDIKKAYRNKAMKYHPDRNPGDSKAEELFKEASEAYQVLSEPEKRSAYDRFGHDGLRGMGSQGFSSFDDIFSSFGDVFSDLLVRIVVLGGNQGLGSPAQLCNALGEKHGQQEPIFHDVESLLKKFVVGQLRGHVSSRLIRFRAKRLTVYAHSSIHCQRCPAPQSIPTC